MGICVKRLISAAVALCILLSFVIQAFSVSIDGFDNGAEWDGASVQLLENGNSNCKITFAAVKYRVASAENAVYLCFMFTDPDATEFNPLAGVVLSVGSDTFTVAMADSPCADDTADHSFDAAITADANHGMTCEVRLGIKSGVPQSVDFSVRFADTVGELSSIYNFTVANPDYTVPQGNVYVPTPDHEYVYPEEKTTKAKKTTTKKETTIKQTTKKKKPTTTRKPKTTAVKTTKPHTTKSTVKTTKAAKVTAKRTAKPKTEQAATVYYYEKEVIISQVVVTVTAATESTATKIERIGGAKVKLFLLALGFLLIVIIGAAGAFGRKNENPPSEKPKSDDSQDGENKNE